MDILNKNKDILFKQNKIKNTTKFNKCFSTFTTIPPELFSKICYFLSPSDLISLSQVCRKFRGFLCSPESFSTQEIWRNSRNIFFPKEDMPPPEGMCEKDYVELLMVNRGCQICKRRKEVQVQIHWAFGIRCCEICFLKNTTRMKELILNYKMPKSLIFALPYVIHNNKIFYWNNIVKLSYIYYISILKKSMQVTQREPSNIMQYVKDRKTKEDSKKDPILLRLSNLLILFDNLLFTHNTYEEIQPIHNFPQDFEIIYKMYCELDFVDHKDNFVGNFAYKKWLVKKSLGIKERVIDRINYNKNNLLKDEKAFTKDKRSYKNKYAYKYG
ncbi:hypothetical protein C1645_800665 [Glomus cerebriforme]|uniref:F-box domain-containing protein n=1 Tax=Glomus cerebriforme TaxID=658196 RepID=A0A397TXA0_9GLOM|nr:hypothetical protein C1645_800665 [Glomus cerebriforme]